MKNAIPGPGERRKGNECCYGLPAQLIARICKVNVKTARNWKNGTSGMPETAKMVLAGDLGVFSPAFAGWTLRGGKLISPERWEATPGDILALPLLRAQVAAYQARERVVQRMDEQPTSDDASAMLAQLGLR